MFGKSFLVLSCCKPKRRSFAISADDSADLLSLSTQKTALAGFIQAVYTVCVIACFAPISMSFWLSFLWQVGLFAQHVTRPRYM